ncbi:MAG: DpnI domain-containing protein [Verrucomicrobiia bacterium]
MCPTSVGLLYQTPGETVWLRKVLADDSGGWRLPELEPGHPASDYSCPHCRFWYQLKSRKSRIGDSITDGAYAAMMNAIRHDELQV